MATLLLTGRYFMTISRLGYHNTIKAKSYPLNAHLPINDQSSHQCPITLQRHAPDRLRQDFHILVLLLFLQLSPLHLLLIHPLNYSALLLLALRLIAQIGGQPFPLLLLLNLADHQSDKKMDRSATLTLSVATSSIAVGAPARLHGDGQWSRYRWLWIGGCGVGRETIMLDGGSLGGGVFGRAVAAMARSWFVAT